MKKVQIVFLSLFSPKTLIALWVITGMTLASFVIVFSRDPWGGLKRSRCNQCREKIPLHHLIPVISYMCLKGRCAYCSMVIPPWIPVLETAGGLVAWTALSHPFPVSFFVAGILLIGMCAKDFDRLEIPQHFLLLFLWWRLFFVNYALDRLLSMVLMVTFLMGVLLIYHWRRRPVPMGWGDVKLMTVMASCLDLEHLTLFLILSGSLGLASAMISWLKGQGRGPFPFAPSLSLSFLISFGG